MENKLLTKEKEFCENNLARTDLLLDWFPEGCKPIEEVKTETTTAMLNFMQRGSNKRDK